MNLNTTYRAFALVLFREYRQTFSSENKQIESSRLRAWTDLCLLLERPLGGSLRKTGSNGLTPFSYLRFENEKNIFTFVTAFV